MAIGRKDAGGFSSRGANRKELTRTLLADAASDLARRMV
jgi:hypothetical protein